MINESNAVKNFRISRKYKVKHWNALTFESETDWGTAVKIFRDRIETRYLEHIDRILRHRTSGFAALTLDCALIETLEQFRRGSAGTPSKKGMAFFVSFLTETSFKEFFANDSAKAFYKNIRCGLIHKGEATLSRIKRNSRDPMISLMPDGEGLVLNAEVFHAHLKTAIDEYVKRLEDPESVVERDAFRKKMDYICESDVAD
jgi:hypothetical protein